MKIHVKKLLSNQELKSELLQAKAEFKKLADKVAAHIPNKKLNLILAGLFVMNLTTLIVVLLK